jgi:hypothetical protein
MRFATLSGHRINPEKVEGFWKLNTGKTLIRFRNEEIEVDESVEVVEAELERASGEIPEGARCEGCSFFWNPNKESICRRRAPVPIVAYAKNQSNSSETGGQTFFEVVGYFPTTDGFGCGEFRPKDTP